MSASTEDLPIEFTGSGSEYFRIWIVNLLLTLVTFGLYLPWAKVRRLRYFYGNTRVGGYPLDFHGDPWKMLRGFLLVGALAVLYSVAGHVSPVAGGLALLLLAGLWPALMRSALQFRLANTSWRGLRPRFRGDLAGAYLAFVPIALPVALWIAGIMLAPQENAAQANGEPSWVAIGALVGAMLLSALLLPLTSHRLTRYRQGHYAIGPWRTGFEPGAGSFYALYAKTSGVSLLAVTVVAIAGLALTAAVAFGTSMGGSGAPRWVALLPVFVMLCFYLTFFVVSGPYFQGRLQDLVWNGTRGPELSFTSALKLGPLMRLTLKNLLLCLLTLGLYWPFAKVAVARLRLESVTMHAHQPIDTLIAQAGQRGYSAAGDAAGDLLGIDIAL